MNYDYCWNIKKLLPYQRNFNFINSIREAGKTYTSGGFVIERFLNKGEQFMLVVRNINEKMNGALSKWIEKVMFKEYPDVIYECNSNTIFFVPEKKSPKSDWIVMGHCRALSEAIKVKKQSFPLVRWMIFEEYMLEPEYFSLYVNGWKEPDLLLNLYQTVDRGHDRVTVFLLGNNTTWYNPYHLHEAFKIPHVPLGEIWKSENVLFQHFDAAPILKDKMEKNKFLKMIEGTEYHKYAAQGQYSDDYSFIEKKPQRAVFSFALTYGGLFVGIWVGNNGGKVYVSGKLGGNPLIYSVDDKPIEGIPQLKNSQFLLNWLKRKYGRNEVYYESMELKVKVEKIIIEKVLRR